MSQSLIEMTTNVITNRRRLIRGIAAIGAGLLGTRWSTPAAAHDQGAPGSAKAGNGPPFLCVEIANGADEVLVTFGISLASRCSDGAIQAFSALDEKLYGHIVRVVLGSGPKRCGKFDCHMDWPNLSMLIESQQLVDCDDELAACNADEHQYVLELAQGGHGRLNDHEQPNSRDVEIFEDVVAQMVKFAELEMPSGPTALTALARRLRESGSEYQITELDLCDMSTLL